MLTIGIIACIAAACLVELRGMYIRRTRPDVHEFARELVRSYWYELPCGGGFVTDDIGATRTLRWNYGGAQVKKLCLAICTSDGIIAGKELPAGAQIAAEDLLKNLPERKLVN